LAHTGGIKTPGFRAENLTAATGPYTLNKNTIDAVIPKIRFRHYKKSEIDLATRFIRSLKLQGDYYFNVVLLSDAAEHIARYMEPLSLSDIYPWCYEIDAVVRQPGAHTLIEFKERPIYTGIGQLKLYEDLYKKQYNPGKHILLALVTDRGDPQQQKVAEKQGIRVYVV